MGIYMGIAHDFSLAPVHAHMNLVGWASLALFGITYKLYPQLQERWPAKLHFALAAPSAILFPIGIYMSINHAQPLLAIAASLVRAGGGLPLPCPPPHAARPRRAARAVRACAGRGRGRPAVPGPAGRARIRRRAGAGRRS